MMIGYFALRAEKIFVTITIIVVGLVLTGGAWVFF